MGKGARSCFLCGRQKNADASFALFSFSRNPQLCMQWKVICDLRADDNVKNLKICNFHFKKEDYYLIGRSLRLKQDAVPLATVVETPGPSGKVSPVPPPDPLDLEKTSSNTKVCTDYALEDNSPVPSPDPLDLGKTSTDDMVCEDYALEHNSPLASPQRKKVCKEPRYVGDVTIEHVSTPRKAARMISKMQCEFKKKVHQLRMTQQELRRCKAHINNLENLVQQLQKDNMLSGDTNNTQTEGLPQRIKRLLIKKRKVREKKNIQ